jgi:uncharacterized protein YpuA (DUF1002 family)
MKWLYAALFTSAGIISAQAYTCADVRALSQEQRAYYIKVFNITPSQQERIRRACSEPGGRRTATSAEGSTSLVHAERDARAGQ